MLFFSPDFLGKGQGVSIFDIDVFLNSMVGCGEIFERKPGIIVTGPKRPKWRLCFRLDRRSATAKESLADSSGFQTKQTLSTNMLYNI